VKEVRLLRFRERGAIMDGVDRIGGAAGARPGVVWRRGA